VALFNESLVGRFNRGIQRLHNMKGGTPAPQVTPEIGHNIILENDRPEHHYLVGSVLAAGLVDVAAVAAQTNNHRLRNPGGSGVMIVVEEVMISSTGAAPLSAALTFQDADLATGLGFKVLRDLRGRNSGDMTRVVGLISRSNNVAPVGQTFASMITAANFPTLWPLKIVLPPGTTLDFNSTGVNIETIVTYVWRERALEPSEV
jgi:hypothetical protein